MSKKRSKPNECDRLTELRITIAEYGPMVGTPADQFAHNIVGVTLSMIAEEFGTAAANEAIADFDLEAKGWKKRDGPDACCDGLKGACCNDLVDHPPGTCANCKEGDKGSG